MRFYKPSLDGLRAFAFTLIFVHHVGLTTHVATGSQFLDNLLRKVNAFGWIGVDIFLCLSAFLITRLLLLEYDSENRISPRKFLFRRALRIWPLYYLYMILAFGVMPLLGFTSANVGSSKYEMMLIEHFIPFFVFLGNWSVGLFGYPENRILGHMWTISLEQQFYLFLPFALGLIAFNRRMRPAMLLIAGLFGISVAARFLAYYWQVPHPFIWANTFTRLDPFILGTLIAFCREKQLIKFASIFPAGLLLPLGLLFFIIVSLFPNIDTESIHVNWQYPAVAVGSSFLLLAVLYDAAWRRIFSSKPLVYMGKISYGCYVYHVIAIKCAWHAATAVGHYQTMTENEFFVLKFLIAFFLTLVISAVSYQFFEKPFLALKYKHTVIASRPL